ncbi:ParB N-terminal domain-containing protein [Corallococcus sp. AB038B]|uniref:ParB/RepB/Spo0J family partition protein n=1 Tax=Corallococcus sp. AB038B TaxID=2316718 RepID=UPI000ED8A678|nr:ParB N-terminal domain-containing protein [Corallococcus sp. AB038B]RKH92968.1 hypothetical protein D7Y04_41845 [Corallococcus sp. AB038B]
MTNTGTGTTKSYIAKKLQEGALPSWDSPSDTPFTLKSLPLGDVLESPEQARQVFNEAKLFEMACSILTRGLLTPIEVSPEADSLGRPTGKFFVIAGERRLRCFRMLNSAEQSAEAAQTYAAQARKAFGEVEGNELASLWLGLPSDTPRFATITALITRAKTSVDRLIDGMTENLQREQLQALEEADGYARAVRKKEEGGEGLTAEQLASKMAKDVQYVRRRLQLAKCSELLREAMTKGILVTKRDEDGRPVMLGEGEGATEARERRYVEDISIALELEKIQSFLLKGLDDPRQKKARLAAEEKFAGLLDDALSRKWSVRKLIEVRTALMDPKAKKKSGETSEEGEGAAAAKPSRTAWTSDEKQLVVRLDRLPALQGEEREKLRARLQELLSSLG